MIDQEQRTLGAWGYLMWVLVTYIPNQLSAIRAWAARVSNTTGSPL